MTAITKYKADDGTEFSDEFACQKYEQQCALISSAMMLLRPIPKDDGCDFGNGGGYVQQLKGDVLEAYNTVLGLAPDIIGKEIVEKVRAAHEFAPRSIIGRYIDDSGHRFLYGAWIRFMNMDTHWREWGQGFFAINPDQGKQIAL